MSHRQGDDAEYMADEYEMEDVEDDMDDESSNRERGAIESDVDDYDYSNSKVVGTTAAQARRGQDIQGIPWDSLSISRERYRQTRLEQYKNYENIPHSGDQSGKDCKNTKKGYSYYEFRKNARSVKSTILHFQLRNLVWATSKHDVIPDVKLFSNPLVSFDLHEVRSTQCFRTRCTIRETSWKSFGRIYPHSSQHTGS